MKASPGASQGAQMGGGVLSAVGQIAGGIAANNAGKFTQKVMRANATNVLNDGVMEAEQVRTAARLAMGRQLVAQGSDGFQMGTGSALDALRESRVERDLEVMRIRRKQDLAATGYRIQGQQARAQGKSAMIGGFISGAATLMDSASKAFGGAG